jgi:hypothetical protein
MAGPFSKVAYPGRFDEWEAVHGKGKFKHEAAKLKERAGSDETDHEKAKLRSKKKDQVATPSGTKEKIEHALNPSNWPRNKRK